MVKKKRRVFTVMALLGHRRIVLAANINWSKLSFLFILSVLKRIQIYPKLQTRLKLSTVAGEHVQVI